MIVTLSGSHRFIFICYNHSFNFIILPESQTLRSTYKVSRPNDRLGLRLKTSIGCFCIQTATTLLFLDLSFVRNFEGVWLFPKHSYPFSHIA